MVRHGALSPELGMGVAIIGFCAVPAASALVTRLRKRELKSETLYEDADGKATPASAKSFSTTRSKIIIFSLAVAGLLSSILLTLFSWHTPRVASENLPLIVGAWVSRSSVFRLSLFQNANDVL